LENNLAEVKVEGALNVVDYYFTIAFSFDFELVWGEMCCKGVAKLKA
jgi:hypothetical protein